MKQKLYISGIAGILALVALIVALALTSSHALAPERSVSKGEAVAPVMQTASSAAPFEQSDPSVCGSPGADPGDCTYQ